MENQKMTESSNTSFYKGLTSKKAVETLLKIGPNVLPEKPPLSDITIFISQLTNPLVYVLMAAGVVTLTIGQYSDSLIIIVAVFINTILGFFQERRAGKALYELKKLLKPTTIVIRDGIRKTILTEDVVPGDICLLNHGDKVPADGKFIKANRLYCNEAMLTGESLPVEKDVNDKAFMGTIIASGQGVMEVEITGKDTQMGKIALQVQTVQEDTPLRRQLSKFSHQLVIIVISLTLFVFIMGIITDKELVEIFSTSVALAVSSIPEGLLVGLTVVLALGMQRILKKKGLVRNLVSAETLGGVTTICVDKTGTLTQGVMQVVGVVGDIKNIALQSIVANDQDDPIVLASFDWAKTKYLNTKRLINKYSRLDSLPFSSTQRFFASLNKSDDSNVIFVNGAPEYVVEWSTLSKKEKKIVREKIEQYSAEGKRLVGLARKEVSSTKKTLTENDVKRNLAWVGMLILSDPIRGGVRSALEKTKSAGIKLMVITGDYANTARSVMRDLNIIISDEGVILGDELEKMSASKLSKRLMEVNSLALFARTTPEQKLKIVEALKKNGEVVAMMGDGVNDAPALNTADIGIVVGSATDVAKESADLVLLDSSFETIIAAIEEGRGIFDNLRKIILYLMSDAFSEIVTVVGAILLGIVYAKTLPLPITAAQILWINLVSDGFPHLALTIDPKRKYIMELGPRDPKEQLVTSWMKKLIAIVSVTDGLIALFIFTTYYHSTGDVSLARSVTFAALGVNSLIYVFSLRMLWEPFWRGNMFENKWLNVAVVAGFALQIMPFMFKETRVFLNLATLSWGDWVLVFSAGLFVFVVIEFLKGLLRGQISNSSLEGV